MYKIKITNRFKQNFKKLKKSGFNMDIIVDVIDKLSKGKSLQPKFKNHPLKGKLKGYYDCHILPDLVLIYKIENQNLILLLFDIGTHSELFK